MRLTFRELLKQYTYYIIIASLVTVALVFMPMLDTNGNIGISMPNSPLGIVAYCIVRGIVGVIVFMIFVSFDSQGKINVKDEELYKKAFDMLFKSEDKNYIPLSPGKYKARTYGVKAVTLALTTTATAFVVMEMILSYNYIVLLTYALSIFTALVGGVIQMKKAEIYWTEEFYRYALWKVKKLNENKECTE